jgi:hypothetical protein
VEVPKVWAQYVPFALVAAPEPIARQFGFSMFARWPDELSQPLNTAWALV